MKNTNNQGQVILIAVLIFSAVAATMVFGTVSPLIKQIQIVRDLEISKKSYFTAEAGSEDYYYRVKNNIMTSFPATLSLNDAIATINLSNIGPAEQLLTSQGNAKNLIRTVIKDINLTNGFSLNFALQVGIGGLYFQNNSRVNGNVYANGPVESNNSNPNSYNIIKGTVVSAGPDGIVRQIYATSSVYSHNIVDTTIDKNAYHESISNSTVGGQSFPNSVDQPIIDLPISDELISTWENDALAGGIATCADGLYTISSSVTLGPKKIPCNLSISGNGTVVSLAGAVWVSGDITISGSGGSGVQIKVADSLGNKSVPVMADDVNNRGTKGVITIGGNSNFYGSSGNPDSYVILLSQNNSAENNGSNLAMNVINGAAGNILTYAGHGEILLQNNVNLRGVTAYKITLINNTVVTYTIGLAQPIFTSGPGGTWKIKRWRESL